MGATEKCTNQRCIYCTAIQTKLNKYTQGERERERERRKYLRFRVESSQQQINN